MPLSTLAKPAGSRAFRSRVAAALLAVTMMGSLAACGPGHQHDGNDASAGSSTSGENKGFPVTIKHTYGSTVIKSKPKRVATVGWGTYDNLIALGVIPVSIQKSTLGKTVHGGFMPWTYNALEKAGVKPADMPKLHDESDSIDTEAIAASKPDLILGMQSGMTREQYETLSKIAPTVAYQKTAWGDPWRDMIRTTAKAIGEPTKGDKLIADLEKEISADGAKYPQIKGKTTAVIYFDTSKLSNFILYTTADVRAQMLDDLGMKTANSVERISRSTSEYCKDVSSENADQFKDVDVIITYGTPGVLPTLQKDPLISKIPAIQRGSVVIIDENSEMCDYNLISSSLSIRQDNAEYAKLLGEAAEKVK
jgi:iron complex transport system substrate-binding protein